MKYLIGQMGSLLGGKFKVRYANCKCIEANTPEEAIRVYKGNYSFSAFAVRCIGFLDDENRLLIPNFHLLYESGKLLKPAPSGKFNHLVSRLLDEPSKLDAFSFYAPDFVQAACPQDALELYKKTHIASRFPAYCIGYLDDNNTFIVPNILDYIT